jgi:hypothetical protein
MARIMTEEQENDIERLPSAWKPLVRKTLERNIKMTTEDILGIWELPQPWDVQGNMVDIAWLKTGNVKSGLKHGWKMEVQLSSVGVCLDSWTPLPRKA